MKLCTKCGCEKDVSDFPRRSAVRDGLSSWCKQCHNAWAATHYKRPESRPKYLNRMYKSKYDLTYDQVVEMWELQGFACAVCGAKNRLGKNNWPSVDHDHATGRVRGLLCHDCNTFLGFAKDDPAILARGIAYLEENRVASDG